ncbi:MAG: hypothetical protein LBJ67_06160, partial [Planctomycetaceae bacterium]|nr:hypothetical protein [Planctomycetaceae bacterium]
EYFAGTHFNPQHTCWNYSADFLKYINRTQFLLQQGLYAADVVQYYGDNVPNFTQGEWNNTAKSLPDYAYDVASKDAVLNMKVFDGRIFLPDGMNYKVLVLPEVSGMDIHVFHKIIWLVKEGATVIGSPPKRASDLESFGVKHDRVYGNDDTVKSYVNELWGKDVSAPKIRQVEKGRIITGMTAAEVLRNDKLPPDVQRLSGSLPDGQHRIKWIHRTLHDGNIFGGKISTLPPIKTATTPEISPQVALNNTNRTEIYFVSNLVAKTDKTEIAFRVTQKQPEFWDALTGTITDAKSFRQENGQTIIPIEFAPYGSVFVVFRKPISVTQQGTETSNVPKVEKQISIDGSWDVSFAPKLGGVEKITFDQLIFWNQHEDKRIKYYSGAATYRKIVTIPKDFVNGDAQEKSSSNANKLRYVLQFEHIAEIAAIRLNDKTLGSVWAKPYQIDVTDAIREGENMLEIEVVNHWANRIIGDSLLPESERLTKTNIQRLTPQTPLVDSGLSGDVVILRVVQ